MLKKFNAEGKVVEVTEYYKVIKSNKDGKFYIYSKYDDTLYVASKYKIVGCAVLEDNDGQKFYSNPVNAQGYGQGRSLTHRMEIDSWETKSNEEVVVTYHDEKDFKYVRYLDEEGNLFKKKSTKQLQEVEMVLL